MMKTTVSIIPPPIHYDILIGDSLLSEDFFSYCHSLGLRLAIGITAPLENSLGKSLLQRLGEKTELIILPKGEHIKGREWKEKIEDILIQKNYGRDSCLVAIGGGAVLDLMGFVASTYCRGIPYISIPTTLLAMTDASIGGKTSVNVPFAKNYIGSFHHPLRIYVDISFLQTLSQREFLSGFVETLKHSLISKEPFFEFLEENLDLILKRDKNTLLEMIEKSCLIKKQIIEMDPFEKTGMRSFLNLGHTIGHGLEALSKYSMRHGEAVAAGIWLEAWMSKEQGNLSEQTYQRILTFLKRVSFSLNSIKSLPLQELSSFLQADKKNRKGELRYVSLLNIGSPCLFPLDEKILQKGISYALCSD